MSASDIVDRHSRYGTTSPMVGGVGGEAGDRSLFSFGNAAAVPDHASMVSSNSARGGIPPAPPSSASHQSSSVAGVGAGVTSSRLQQQQQQQQMRPDSSALPPQTSSPSAYQRYPHHQQGASELPTSYSPTQTGVGGVVGVGNQQSQQQQQQQQDQNPSPRGESGVSAFSEREKTHLRNISDPATVSTMDATIGASSPPLGAQQHRFSGPGPMIMEEGTGTLGGDDENTPTATATGAQGQNQTLMVSPPTAGEDGEGEDYLSARGSAGDVSPVVPRGGSNQSHQNLTSEEGRPGSRGRRSAFRESEEDI